ncbi:MAG: ABC transporter ATP-binding protein [Phycisphaerales bacterium]|nr:ABC transporter ATP-binding protein [Phycisphaerales bacterium]MCI0629827.1 ABC transporter ATP-binding protein [Phycisphaerales bacterium]MCI0675852.1 ABC transporter ATP-binding protein [Phycisphaerales bacterium]
MSTVLSVADARKSFSQTKALDGASMTLNKGEWLALLGPNGAGKTTLIRAVTGRVKLDAGSITLLGQPLNGHSIDPITNDARKQLGVVPQDIGLYPLLTARENLRAFGELHDVSGPLLEQRIAWALDWTGLADRADTLTKTFSGGMKRRLNIACGVLHRPQVVLLDEPTVGVDPQSRQRIWEMLGQLRDAGASLLLTTHQLDEAQQVCDRITIIDHGKTIADGSLAELIAQTIGRQRRITLTLDRPLSGQLHNGLTMVGPTTASGEVIDVASDLPAMLDRVRAAGARVNDLKIEAPSLQAVFIHLTGRELRE